MRRHARAVYYIKVYIWIERKQVSVRYARRVAPIDNRLVLHAIVMYSDVQLQCSVDNDRAAGNNGTGRTPLRRGFLDAVTAALRDWLCRVGVVGYGGYNRRLEEDRL